MKTEKCLPIPSQKAEWVSTILRPQLNVSYVENTWIGYLVTWYVFFSAAGRLYSLCVLLNRCLYWSIFFLFPGCHFNGCHWRCWHACSYYCPEQLFWMGFVCWGLPAEQQLADHCWCTHWLLWGHPLLHHVCGKKSAEILRVFQVIKNLIQHVCYEDKQSED